MPVSDLEQGVRFYSGLFERSGERVSPGRHYFNAGGAILVCYDAARDGDGHCFDRQRTPVYFTSANLDDLFRRCCDLGATCSNAVRPDFGVLGRIEMRPWGERSFYVDDPFGNQLCFVDEATALEADEWATNA